MKLLQKTLRQLRGHGEKLKQQATPHIHTLMQRSRTEYRQFLALRSINPKRFYLLSGVLLTGILIVGSFSLSMFQSGGTTTLLQEASTSKYRTLQVELLRDSSLLIPGTVLSNETANIYVRRDGIVEDVYVDIGDEVEKGEVVALLLPQGVEGQSAAKIAEKSAMQARAEADHLNAQSVAIESVSKAEQQIAEKKTALEIAKREQQGLIKKMAQSAEHVIQMRDQAFLAARDARQAMERILTGSNARVNGDIREDEILRAIGSLSANNIKRHEIVSLLNALYDTENFYLNAAEAEVDTVLRKYLAQIDETFLVLHDLLALTGGTPIYQPGRDIKLDPTDIINTIHTTQSKALLRKEMWQDALLAYEELIASEPELYKAMLGEMENAQSNKVKLLTSQLQTTENSHSLIESQQQQMIERSEKAVKIANASLRAESAQSGHRKIRSPFTGIISKRFIDVGEVVMTSRPAFELVDVPTSLAKEAKTEIKFGLPEHLQSSVDIDSTITFLMPGDDELPYEAIVTRKSPQVDRETRTITVQAKIADDISLPHQSNVRVRIDEHGEPVYRIPSYAVKREEEGNILWVLDTETDEPMQKSITVIAEDGEFAEVTGDIDAKTLVILDPPDLFGKKETDSTSTSTP